MHYCGVRLTKECPYYNYIIQTALPMSIDIRDICTWDWKHNYCADNVCYAINEKLCGTVANRWFG